MYRKIYSHANSIRVMMMMLQSAAVTTMQEKNYISELMYRTVVVFYSPRHHFHEQTFFLCPTWNLRRILGMTTKVVRNHRQSPINSNPRRGLFFLDIFLAAKSAGIQQQLLHA